MRQNARELDKKRRIRIARKLRRETKATIAAMETSSAMMASTPEGNEGDEEEDEDKEKEDEEEVDGTKNKFKPSAFLQRFSKSFSFSFSKSSNNSVTPEH